MDFLVPRQDHQVPTTWQANELPVCNDLLCQASDQAACICGLAGAHLSLCHVPTGLGSGLRPGLNADLTPAARSLPSDAQPYLPGPRLTHVSVALLKIHMAIWPVGFELWTGEASQLPCLGGQELTPLGQSCQAGTEVQGHALASTAYPRLDLTVSIQQHYSYDWVIGKNRWADRAKVRALRSVLAEC
jgi:hypothetical protein